MVLGDVVPLAEETPGLYQGCILASNKNYMLFLHDKIMVMG